MTDDLHYGVQASGKREALYYLHQAAHCFIIGHELCPGLPRTSSSSSKIRIFGIFAIVGFPICVLKRSSLHGLFEIVNT